MQVLDESQPRSPRAVHGSLLARGAALADPRAQLRCLEERGGPALRFADALAGAGWLEGVPRGRLEVFQVNLGHLCNMACRHCHVDAGPDRVDQNMDRETVDQCLAALDRTQAHTVDITGGAPELNPHFPWLVDQCIARGRHVIDRCNLTVLELPRLSHLPEWLAERGVEVVASLPHNRAWQTDRQRGEGTFEKSVSALRRLNAAGYGRGDPRRRLTLMHNPAGAYLPGAQGSMEREWKADLGARHGVSFDRLISLNNMPIARFLDWLEETDNTVPYLRALVSGFNPGTLPGLMCRNTVSIAWDGSVFDCDFNQMLDLPSRGRPHVRDLAPARLGDVVTDRHCFGCTAGAGSSCQGATAG